MEPVFFSDQMAFRSWLTENHETEAELIVGFHKVHTGKQSMTWSESVDQALCFGWIDGVRRSLDQDSYQIRFSKRKANSNWSAVNVKKVIELSQKGLMQEAGLKAFNLRTEDKSAPYSYEKQMAAFPKVMEEEFKSDQKAWQYFESLAPSYKKASINWVLGAKQQITQMKRLKQLISESAAETNQWKDNKYSKK